MKGNRSAQELHAAIARAIEQTPEAPMVDLVRWMHEHHQPLINKFEQEWIDEKLAALLTAAKRNYGNAGNPMRGGGRPKYGHPDQSRLQFIENFEQIPFWIYLEPTSRNQPRPPRVQLPKATLQDLKKRRALIKGEQSRELPQLNRLIAIMELYDKAQPGITVKAALELRSTARREEKA